MSDTAVQDKPAAPPSAPPSANGETKAIAEQTKKQAPSIAISNKGLTPTNLEELWRFSVIVEKSGLCPKGMGIDAIFISIQMGLEIGLSPMQAMQSTAVINGRPAIYGDAAKALVEASGLMEDYEQWYELDGERLATADGHTRTPTVEEMKYDSLTCCVMSKRINRKPLVTTFSVGDAKLAGIWGKNVWANYPSRMMLFRARGFNLRDNFGDVLKGLRTVEEQRDEPLDVTHAELPPEDKPLLSKLQERAAQVDATRTEPLAPTKPAEPTTTEAVVEKPSEASAQTAPEPAKIDAEELKELERLAFPKHPSLNSWRKSVKEIYKINNVASLTPEQAVEERKRLAELPAMGN